MQRKKVIDGEGTGGMGYIVWLSHARETLDEANARLRLALRPGCPIGIESCRPLVSQRSQGPREPSMAQEIRVPGRQSESSGTA